MRAEAVRDTQPLRDRVDSFSGPLGEHLAALRAESDRLGSRLMQFREGIGAEQLTLESASEAPAQELEFVDAEVVEDHGPEPDEHPAGPDTAETPALVFCSACEGSGDCPRCRGRGRGRIRRCGGCAGSGRCATCHGEGSVTPPARSAGMI